MDGGSEWSADAAVAEMTDAGAFGSGCAFVSYEPDERLAGSDQYATVVRFGTATVAVGGGGVRRRHRLVIKLKPPEPRLREFLNSDSQFHNEKLFYERAAPFLLDCAPPADGHRPPLCRYFYCRNECGALASRDMIVLENCCAPPRNYRMSDDRLDLDVDHVLTALRTLAKFHGLSYRAKHARPAEFHDLVAGFRDTHWRDGLWLGGIPVVDLLSPSVDELLRPERSDGDGTAAAARRFRAEFLSDAYRAIRRTMEPVEPYAVLCHGDFNRNNLMFRYGGDGNPTVLDAMPFDMATVRYGSPALDLSFFLYLNTDRRLRDARWDAMLDEYCAALSAACSDVPCDAVPDRARLESEMREHAFYGLAHVSFFSRFLMEQQNGEPTDAPRFTDGDVNGLEDVMRSLLSYGGHRAAERVTDVVRHFLRVRYGKSTPTTTT